MSDIENQREVLIAVITALAVQAGWSKAQIRSALVEGFCDLAIDDILDLIELIFQELEITGKE